MSSQGNIVKMYVAALALLVLLSACATKTTVEPTATPPSATPAATEPALPTTDLSRQPAALDVASQPAQSGEAADYRAVAGLQRVHFAYNEFTLDAAAQSALEQNAAYLRKNPTLNIVIEGHCDERGSDEYNLALGERRAVAARNYLQSLGIEAGRLSIISYGEEKPLVVESNEAAWAQNRRAEFKAVR